MLRRTSLTGPPGLGGPSSEPLIVVEESGAELEEEEEDGARAMTPTTPLDSPLLQNPYLLSPYRDLRKRSLPTPQCTSGITASQVRRLSEQGGEGSKCPSARETAFLATLSQAPVPQAGGRRHSVVTISRAPPTSVLFGRNRRESIAAFPAGLPLAGRLSRKDSSSSIAARSPSLSGSSFNLQLDIMDDIADIKTPRKVRLKMWQDENEEKICELEPMEGGAAPQRYQAPSRRLSEIPQPVTQAPAKEKRRASGIVCTNTDLMSIMSLTSSAQEINTSEALAKVPEVPTPAPSATAPPSPAPAVAGPSTKPPSSLDQKRGLLKGARSSSFDVSLLPDCKDPQGPNWFARRHQPMANKKYLTPRPATDQKPQNIPPPMDKSPTTITFADEKVDPSSERKKSGSVSEAELKNVLWDKPSGAVIDAEMIGSAIEVYLNKKGGESEKAAGAGVVAGAGTEAAAVDSPPPSAGPSDQSKSNANAKGSSWFGNKPKPADEEEGSCDNSICSTLKDLFVK
ncbi:uncharacterized protein LOC111048858 [Nilaparvata lugens]|uniref:uncharacterized protein LOC111048858 n=1 Tax=Nilaparvata lugens TaxID=108931 RepID=UPI00193E1CCA|nr:uncharacterized protein LOC111048858 [Nilaparvata lugens]XP_039277520.1 uncharacterized protein LOC111048858 [Nilaparvata lugens]